MIMSNATNIMYMVPDDADYPTYLTNATEGSTNTTDIMDITYSGVNLTDYANITDIMKYDTNVTEYLDLHNTTDIIMYDTTASPAPSTAAPSAAAAAAATAKAARAAAADAALVKLGNQIAAMQAYNVRMFAPLAFRGELTSLVDSAIKLVQNSLGTVDKLGTS